MIDKIFVNIDIMITLRIWIFIVVLKSCHCCNDCRDVVDDIVFVLDSSSSIGKWTFEHIMTQFVKYFIRQHSLVLGPANTQVGVVAFADNAHIDIPLNGYSSKSETIDSIEKYFTYRGGYTDTDHVLQHIHNHILSTGKGDRPGAENKIVILTDGDSYCNAATQLIANKLKSEGVTIHVIPVGDCHTYLRELSGIASGNERVHSCLHDWNIKTLARELWNVICKESSSSHHNTPTTSKHAMKTTSHLTRLPSTSKSIRTTPKPTARPSSKAPIIPHTSSTTAFRTTAKTTKILLPISNSCVDEDPGCGTYPLKELCTKYKDWAWGNCRKTCVFCEVNILTTGKQHWTSTPALITIGTARPKTTALPTVNSASSSRSSLRAPSLITITSTKSTSKTPMLPTTIPTLAPSSKLVTVSTMSQQSRATTRVQSSSKLPMNTTISKPSTKSPSTHLSVTTLSTSPTKLTAGVQLSSKHNTNTSTPTKSTKAVISTPTTPSKQHCFDMDPFCATYPKSFCQNNRKFAYGNCRKECGFCSVSIPSTHQSVIVNKSSTSIHPTTAGRTSANVPSTTHKATAGTTTARKFIFFTLGKR